MARKPTKKALASQAARMLKLKAKAGALYAEAEKIGNDLSRFLQPGDELKLADGVCVQLVDPFVNADGAPQKHWRHVPVTRWDFKVVTPKPDVSNES